MTSAQDRLIDTLAATKLGLVTRKELLQHGISAPSIDRRVKAQRLRLLHRGVYRVGPLEVAHARELAAVLACGPHAFLSHTSAASLWELLPEPDAAAPVHVTLRRGDRGRRPDIRVHRVPLRSDNVTTLHGIPVTTVARTVVDLAAVLPAGELERVLTLAERRGLLDHRALQSLAARRGSQPGIPVLRTLLASEAESAFTRSEAEDRFLALIRKAKLPVPETNVRLGDCEVDFLWRRERLVVEVDGFAFHSSKQSFESDRRRDAGLLANGMSVLRVTWRQIVQEPEATLARLAQTLGRLRTVEQSGLRRTGSG